MNILFLNSARRGWGGNEKWTLLASEKIAEKHNTFLAYRDPLIASRFGIKTFRLPFLVEIDPVTIIKLIGIIRKQHIDILIPTKRKDYVLAGIACRLCGATNILRLGINRPLNDTFWQKLVYRTLTDGIIVNSRKIKETLAVTPWIEPEKIRVIYNGVDYRELDIRSNEPFPKPASFIIAAAGSLTARKGFDMLIRSFSIFLRNYPDADAALLIAGEGQQLNELKQLAKTLNIHEKVILTGFLDNPYPLYKTCDIFVSASSSEGISNALLEAMYLGSVPISTPSGGIEEIMLDGENGFLIPFADEKKLAAVIGKLYNNPQYLNTVGSAAHETVTQLFSIPRMEQELLDFLSEMIRNKQRS